MIPHAPTIELLLEPARAKHSGGTGRKLLRARTGKIIEELNRSCTEANTQKLAR